jgi:hypothetical protein
MSADIDPGDLDTGDLDQDDVDQAAEALEDANEDVTPAMRWSGFVWLVAVFGTLAVAIGAAVYFDYVTVDLAVSATVNIGWVVEYLVAGLVAVFLIMTFAALLIWLPGSFWGAVTRALGYAATGYQETNTDDDN